MGLNDLQRKLFSEFPPVSAQEWEEKIKTDLKGADYEKKLIWKTDEGFEVKPYYRSENLSGLEYLQSLPGEPFFVRGNKKIHNNWMIRQDIPVMDIGDANRIALDAVKKGADSLNLCAVDITTHKQMNRLLNNIDLLKTNISFMSSRSYLLTLELFIYEVNQRKIESGKISGSLNFDPISYLLLHGDFYISKENNFEEAEYLLRTIEKKLPDFKAFTINGHFFPEAGSTIVQELALSIASANEFLFELTSRGISIDSVSRNLILSLGIGSDYFLEIAKLRAARLLWSKIVEQYHPKKKESLQIFIHSQTVLRNKAIFDPYVNMLRTTTEGMSAAIGNSDSISISPFDSAFSEPDDFSVRIARNQQIILKEEAYLDKVIDASAGSYYIENLTHTIGVHAWDLFLKIEERGGIIECIKSGFVQDEIEASRQKKEMNMALRKTVMIGLNQYPNLKESMLDKVIPQSAKANPDTHSKYRKLNLSRDAQPFEMLRLAMEQFIASGKKKPSVYLLTFGNPAMRKARVTFATNFFGCAGYEILEETTSQTIEDGVKAVLDAKAEMVVICSSDEEYAIIAPTVVQGIKKENSAIKVIVAGYPKEIVESLKMAGVDDFIHLHSNLIETLTKYHKMLGIID
jgi:methylmalonyl-CoA mutase